MAPKSKEEAHVASTPVEAALRMAASSLCHSETASGAYYRQIGEDVAVFATARKLATIIYRLLRWGQPYMDEGAQKCERRYRDYRIQSLTARAKEQGSQLAPTTA